MWGSGFGHLVLPEKLETNVLANSYLRWDSLTANELSRTSYREASNSV
jgi:hypothetical protein